MSTGLQTQDIYDSIIKNRRIKVFLSSTFKDMLEERDYLAKNIFLELEAEAIKRNVALNLLDLRWGITAEESEQGLVTEICLKEIDASRPFFIGIIGNRYGWIPKEEDFANDSPLFNSFPWIKEDIKKGLSITEIEIQYGVLRSKFPVKAFFYIKEGSMDTLGNPNEETEKINNLKNQIIAQKEHSVKYFKSSRELGQLIKDDIMELFARLFPQSDEHDPIKKSNYIQDCILRKKSEYYVRMKGTYEYIDDFLISPHRLLVINGESGTGKSSLLAYWINYNKNSNYKIIYHFVDSSYYGNYPSFILVRFYYKICELLDITPSVDWTRVLINDYVKEINRLISTCGCRFVFIIDGLNQLEASEDAYNLNWFPQLNDGVKIICSANNDKFEIINSLLNKSADFYVLPLFSDFQFVKSVINGYLSLSGKKLEDNQITFIYNNKLFEKPLLLFFLLEELRLWGIYEELDNIINHYVSSVEQDEFLTKIFKRLERDLSFFNRDIIAEVFILLTLSRNGITDSDIADILGFARIQVSSLLHKCHRFISVLGAHSIISHSLIIEYVRNKYAGYYKIVENKYRTYLINKLSNSTRKNFATVAQEMGYFLYQSSLDNDLYNLCTNPNAFMVFTIYSEIEDLTYWKHLFQQGFTMQGLLDRFNEISQDIIEEAIPLILYRARGICANAHNNNELKRIIDYSIHYLDSNPNCKDTDWLWLYCSLLTYYIRVANKEKASELADIVLSQTGENKSYTHFRIIACQYKAQTLLDNDFALAIKYLEESAELSLSENTYESAIVAYINLGLFLSQRGEYDKALHYYKIAQELIDKEIKNDASLIIQRYICLNNLAGFYHRIGNANLENEYDHNAKVCFLKIQNLPYSSRLSPEQTLLQYRIIGFNMMLNGKLEEGVSQLNHAIEMLEKNQADMPLEIYYLDKFKIMHDVAKGYAFNNNYKLAVEQLVPYDEDICKLFKENPIHFHEIYFDHLHTFANIMSDLGYYKASLFFYKTIINQGEQIERFSSFGRKSYIAEIWEKIAILFIKENEKVEALNAFEKSIDAIIPYIDNCNFLQLFAKYEIEKEYYREEGAEFQSFDIECLRKFYTKNKTNNPSISAFIAIYMLTCSLDVDKSNYIQIKDYVDTILNGNYFKHEDMGSKQYFALLPLIADYCDRLSVFYWDNRELNKSIYYSKISVTCYERDSVKKNKLSELQALRHLANTLDAVGDKEQSFIYYKRAIDECNAVRSTNFDIVFMKSRLLYDYGVALYATNIVEAEYTLHEALNIAHSIYDNQSEVSIIIADIQEALGNVYDDTNRPDEAEKMYKSAIHVLSKNKDGSDFSDRLGKYYNNYGIMLVKQNRREEAKNMLKTSREIRLNYDKKGLIRTDDILYRLAFMEEDYNAAYKYLKEILETEREFNILSSNLLNEYVSYTDAFANVCIRINKVEEGKQAYKNAFDMVFLGSFQGGYSDSQLQNITTIVVRVNELFGTTDFLKE